MRKLMKRITALALTFAMLFTAELFVPQNTTEVQAASSVYFNRYSTKVVTYQPDDHYRMHTATLSIMGCTKATEIKNLKSSNTGICRVKARPGYVQVYYYKKAGTATISCKVKGKKISTKFTVKKYQSPIKSLTIGKKNFASKFKGIDNYDYYHTDKIKKQKLKITTANDWVIQSISTTLNGTYKFKYQSKPVKSYSEKISSAKKSDEVWIRCYNRKTKMTETVILYLHYED